MAAARTGAESKGGGGGDSPAPGSASLPLLPQLSARRWLVLIISSIGIFLATLDSSNLAVALPVISSDLRLSLPEALLVQASYLLIVTILLIPVGRWAERRGLFYVYWLGNLLFAIFSAAVALSPNGLLLVGTRALQGIGAAFILTTSAAIVTAIFPSRERGRALGLNMVGVTLGYTLGPPLGGLIVSRIGWEWIFLVKVPIALATVVAGFSLLRLEREDMEAVRRRTGRPAGSPARIDIPGAGLMGVMLLALFVPLIFSPIWGWDDWRTLVPLVGAVALAVVFVVIEARIDDPILDLGLFRRSRVFTAANAASLLFMAGTFGVTTFIAIFLQVVQDRSAQVAGLVLLVQPAVMTVVTPFSGRLSDRIGSRGLSFTGMVVMAVGTAQMALFTLSSPLWQVAVALGTLGLGISIFSTPNFSAIMGSVDRTQLGVASGLFTASRFTGMGISISILGAIAASKLGPEGGRVILLGVRAGVDNAQAFAAGFQEAMLVGTAFALIGAGVCLTRERRERRATEPA